MKCSRFRSALSLLLVLLLAFAAPALLAACGGSDSGSSGENSNHPSFTINGQTVELRLDTHHNDMYYMDNVLDFHSNTAGSFRELTLERDGQVLSLIHLVYFRDKDIPEVLEGTSYETTEVTRNGNVYTSFEYEENGKIGKTFMHVFDGTTYSISFVSDYDTESMIACFLDHVSFRKSDE